MRESEHGPLNLINKTKESLASLATDVMTKIFTVHEL